MKKMRMNHVVIIIVVIVAALIAAFFGFIMYIRKNMYLDGPDMVNRSNPGKSLTYVEWHRSGGSDGSYSMVCVERISDTEAVIKTVDEESAGADTVERSYECSAEIFDELGVIIDQNDMLNWDKLEKSEFEELDGPRTVLIIKQGDATMTTDSDLEWPDYDAVNSIKKIIEDHAE